MQHRTSSDDAFPATQFDNEIPIDCSPGLSKREFAALLAMAAMLANGAITNADAVATIALTYADALLDALDNNQAQ